MEEISRLPVRDETANTSNQDDASKRQHVAKPVPASKVVAKPAPQVNQRDFQISQVVRRFSARQSTSDDSSTLLTFSLNPSDPDFPFDLPKGLHCVLHVPQDYAQGEGKSSKNPSLDVKNPDMNRGFQVNVERGFDRFVERNPQAGLLGWMKMLDKDLETLLMEQKADIVTFVANNAPSVARVVPAKKDEAVKVAVDSGKPSVTSKMTSKIAEKESNRPRKSGFSAAEKEIASMRRQAEISQLEARLGRLPLFSKSATAEYTFYKVPITPLKASQLPATLKNVRMVRLRVPSLYPLQQCSVELLDTNREAAEKVEIGFVRKMSDKSKQVTLMGAINWLAQSMHSLATAADVEPIPEVKAIEAKATVVEQVPPTTKPSVDASTDEGKSHVIKIPRPPEWSQVGNEESDTDSYDSEEFTPDEEEDEDEQESNNWVINQPSEPQRAPPERGISLNFPDLTLRHVEILELVKLNISVKCNRCKSPQDITGLRNTTVDNRHESCRKCSANFIVDYQRELLHENCARAGYLNLTGCTPADLLPSQFIPTCSSCSTPVDEPGVSAVRGPSPAISICRNCHTHMSFTIPSVKFQLASQNPNARAPAPRSRRPKENLGIVSGEPLPSRGRCTHYSKSYRWFRFSCCQKVFACDKCHDKDSDHPNEHANRMICGYCSREQNYRPEDCGICHMSLVKKVGRGFWEGGKGTRDQTRMSRKGELVESCSEYLLIATLFHVE